MALDRGNPKTRSLRKPTSGPIDLSAEICVVGSGSAGFSAALTAARLGKQVLLVDAMPSLGGQAVGTLLGTFCGLYANGPDPYRVTYGVADEMLTHLHAEDAIAPRRARNSVILQYEEAVLARWVERSLLDAGVEVLTGATLRGVETDGRRLGRLDIATRWGDVTLSADAFIDASGDAALAWHAGLPVQEPQAQIYGSQMITLEGIDEAALAKTDRWAMQKVLEEKHEEYGLLRGDGFVFAFPGKGFGVANMTHIETPTDPLGASRAGLAGRDQADRLLAFLRAEFPEALGRARIRAYGLPGIRQTRWITGAHQLTVDEVRAGTRPDDAIARCSWPIELHDRPDSVHWEEFEDDHMHYVPLGSLTPDDADNLVAAGRCIDGEVGALAAVRVMGPCMAMGQAAAHVVDLAGSGSVHQIDIAALQTRLADNLERRDRDPWTAGM